MTDYNLLCKELFAITEGVPHEIANLANACALLWQHLENINWAGFYKIEGEKLVLGPFQGKPACIEITIGKGVCGTAVSENSTLVIEDVHKFEGHIACDPTSNSEIVVPIHVAGKIWGVLDIDSPYVGTFNSDDKIGLENFVSILEKTL